MKYHNQEHQIRDAVEVLAERLQEDGPQWNLTPSQMAHQREWRADLVRLALREIENEVSEAVELDRMRSSATRAELGRIEMLLRRLEISAAKLPSQLGGAYSEHIDGLRLTRVKQLDELPPARPHRPAHRQQAAVKWAGMLIADMVDGYPLSSGFNSQFNRLASILYGDDKADLKRHAAAYMKERNETPIRELPPSVRQPHSTKGAIRQRTRSSA